MAGAVVTAAAEDAGPTVVIKDHVFQPAEIHVPADEPIVCSPSTTRTRRPRNSSRTSCRVEKIIPGHLSGIVRFGPLEPGTYPFFGEFNQATAQGKVVAE